MRKNCALLIWLLSAAASPAAQQQYLIDTIAGGPPPVTSQAAASAAIGFAISVAADSKGNVYFASEDLHSVFRLDTNGTVIRIAGNTIAGFMGDGGPATSAQLHLINVGIGSPGGLAVDSAGNLFIADTGNNRIRRVSPSGVIATVAGAGKNSSYGEGVPAVDADLSFPTGIALDRDGNLFIAERGTNRVRKISTSGIITTVAGTGNGGYGGDGGPAVNALLAAPAGLAVDAAGNLFIADSYNNRVRKVSPDGIITTFAGNGPNYLASGTASELPFPVAVAVNEAGNLLVLQLVGARVLELSANGTLLRTVAGSNQAGFSGDGGPATSAQLMDPFAMALDVTGNLYIADTVNYRIRKVSRDGTINTVAGSGGGGFMPQQGQQGDGGPAKGAPLSAWGVAVDSKGDLFVADASDHRIRKISPDGTISTVAGTGSWGFSGDNGPAIDAQLYSPFGLTLDALGNLFFIDAYNLRVRKISPGGIINTIAGSGKMGFSGDGGPATSAAFGDFSWCNTPCGGLAIDAAGNLFIADPGNARVRKVSPDGIITTVAGNGTRTYGSSGDGGQATDAQLGAPTGVAVDTAGTLFIADAGAGSIRSVSPDGTIRTVVSSGLSAPSGVAIDVAGNLFIADPGWNFYTGELPYLVCCDQRVVKVSPDGTISAVAGSGHPGYSGDGGAALTASLNGPVSVAVDDAGNVYVADVLNRAVRLLHPIGRSVLIGAVVDAASQQAGPVSPGKIVVIYGAGLGPSPLVQNRAKNGQLSTELNGTSVSFNGFLAPILYTSSTQVAVVVPYGVSGSPAGVTVTYQGQASAEFAVPTSTAAPGVFTLNQAGSGQAAAFNVADGTVNSPANAVKIGEYLSLYATGEGQTMPGGVDGKVAGSTPMLPRLPVNVMVGGIAAAVQYAGSAPGQVAGLLQVNVQIPSGVRAGGYVPIVLQVGDSSTTPGAVWITVSN